VKKAASLSFEPSTRCAYPTESQCRTRVPSVPFAEAFAPPADSSPTFAVPTPGEAGSGSAAAGSGSAHDDAATTTARPVATRVHRVGEAAKLTVVDVCEVAVFATALPLNRGIVAKISPTAG
jgi:hypothetical protein